MIPLQFVFSADSIFTGVKQETSYIAERATTKDGQSLYESIVFDEEYLSYFYDKFNDAKAELKKHCSAYIKDHDHQLVFINDVTQQKEDCILTLYMPKTFKKGMASVINTKMREFLVTYVAYIWLSDKMAESAELMQGRADYALQQISSSLETRVIPIRLKGTTIF